MLLKTTARCYCWRCFTMIKPDLPQKTQLNSHTNFIHHSDHFLQLVRTDVRAVSEAKVDQHPLAEEVLAGPGLSLVVNKREGSS